VTGDGKKVHFRPTSVPSIPITSHFDLKMKAGWSSETLVYYHNTTWVISHKNSTWNSLVTSNITGLQLLENEEQHYCLFGKSLSVQLQEQMSAHCSQLVLVMVV